MMMMVMKIVMMMMVMMIVILVLMIDNDGGGDEKGFPVNNFLWIYPSSISLTISGPKSKSFIFVCRKHLTNPITIPWVMMMMRALTMMAMMVMMAAMSKIITKFMKEM